MGNNPLDTNNQNIYSQLAKIGLSNQEARAYVAILDKGPLTVKNLSKILNILPNSIYRLLDSLKSKKFIVDYGKHPSIYKAISPSVSIEALSKDKIIQIQTVKENLVCSLTNPVIKDQTRIEIIYGQSEFFLNYSLWAKHARSEILIISIGEPVSEEIYLANRDAISRRVKIYFLAHKHDKTNDDLLRNWVKIGLEVRHFPISGFHLVTFDRKVSLLAINNPKNTNDRTGLLINNPALSKALSNYFFTVWKKAVKIRK